VGGALFFELYHRAVARYSDGDYNECVLLCAMAIERATFDVIHLEMHRRGIPDSAGLVEDLSARLGITHTIREVLPLVVPGIVKGSLVRDLSKVLSVRNKIMHLSSVKNADLRSRIAGLALSVDQVSAGDAHSHLDATSRFLSLCAQYINSNAPSLGQSEGPKPEREPAP
jgi:hypothetical protein